MEDKGQIQVKLNSQLSKNNSLGEAAGRPVRLAV